jgi:hypothetical protein
MIKKLTQGALGVSERIEISLFKLCLVLLCYWYGNGV